MTKKTALIILVIIILLVIGVFGFFFFYKTDEQNQGGFIDTARNIFGGFFPASQNNNSQNNDSGDEQNNNNENGGTVPKLRKITDYPVSGAIIFEREATSSVLVEETGEQKNEKIIETVYSFVERATGHIYETTTKNLSQKRITNTTIPKTQKSFFSRDGESVVMIYLDDFNSLETFIGKINYPQKSTSTEMMGEEVDNLANITGTFLPTDSFSFNKDFYSDNFLFLNNSDSGSGLFVTDLYIGNIKNSSQITNIFSLKTSEWTPSLLKNDNIALNTKSSVSAQGYLYFLDTKTKIMKKILGNTIALNSLVRPDGKKVLYSYNDAGTTKTVVYDLDKKIYTTINAQTLPKEKCIWSEKEIDVVFCAVPINLIRGDFPDVWYQGKYFFNDGLVKINTNDFSITTLLEPNTETKEILDITNLQISPKEDYLMFINKQDLTLWSYDIL